MLVDLCYLHFALFMPIERQGGRPAIYIGSNVDDVIVAHIARPPIGGAWCRLSHARMRSSPQLVAMNELEDHVLIALRRIIRATDLHSRALGKETGLTTPQLVVLRSIMDLDSPTVTAIARSVSLSQATVTTILNRLEARGLLRRQRCKTDRRAVNVHLTATGIALWRDAPEPLQHSFTQRFKQLASRDQHNIVAALEWVAAMMDAEELDAAPMLASGEAVH